MYHMTTTTTTTTTVNHNHNRTKSNRGITQIPKLVPILQHHIHPSYISFPRSLTYSEAIDKSRQEKLDKQK